MFDPVSMVKYAQTPASVLESPEHKAQSLKMARQSIVLLRNENHTLPLSKKIKKIAVIGPNADNAVAVLGNYNGIPSQIITPVQGIRDKVGNNVEVVFEKAINYTNDTVLVYADVENQYSFDGKKGFRAEYYNNKELKGEPIVQSEEKLDHFWQEGQAVTGDITASNFSARYTTNFTSLTEGSITFELDGDDGYRLLVNGKEQINTWTRNRFGARTYKLNTAKDSVYKLVVEYWQGEGKANIRLRAGHFERTNFSALASRVSDADAIVFVGGISPQLEGEEMRVDYPGFNGGDRTTIQLPGVQTDLLKALKNTGKPVIFVMMTGSAIAIPWENENIPGIINAWYGGQSAGSAIADVLFGDYNPAGRLPVTFYKSDSDLPGFSDYSMNNRTYRYFRGEPLYGFGFGLSYTSFHYDQLKMPTALNAGKSLLVSARVTNKGKMDGEEVIEVYVSHADKLIKAPLKALKGFRRVSLKAGESRTLQFKLSPDDLSVVDENGKLREPKGSIIISVGGRQPDEKNPSTSDVVTGTVKIN
jgi:beta-glucosidase